MNLPLGENSAHPPCPQLKQVVLSVLDFADSEGGVSGTLVDPQDPEGLPAAEEAIGIGGGYGA